MKSPVGALAKTLLFVFAATLCSLPAHAQEGEELPQPHTPAVEGNLLGPGGEPLDSARVVLLRQSVETNEQTLRSEPQFTFEVKEPGGYFLLLPAPGVSVHVVPLLLHNGGIVRLRAQLPPDSVEDASPQITFNDSVSASARLFELRAELEKRRQKAFEAIKAHREAGNEPDSFRYDWSAHRAFVRRQIKKAESQQLKNYLRVRYFGFRPPASDSLWARRVLKKVDPTSPAWSLQWATYGPTKAFNRIRRIAKAPAQAREYADRILEKHPNPSVRAAFLYQKLAEAHDKGDRERAGRLYTRLKNQYSDVPGYAQRAKKRFAPSRAIRTGRQVPDFSLPALSDSVQTYTDEDLRGKVYLVDVWAT